MQSMCNGSDIRLITIEDPVEIKPHFKIFCSCCFKALDILTKGDEKEILSFVFLLFILFTTIGCPTILS